MTTIVPIRQTLFSTAGLAILADMPSAGTFSGRMEFARTVCARFDFVDALGNWRVASCIAALRDLEAAGRIQLPPGLANRSGPARPRMQATPVPPAIAVPDRADRISGFAVQLVTTGAEVSSPSGCRCSHFWVARHRKSVRRKCLMTPRSRSCSTMPAMWGLNCRARKIPAKPQKFMTVARGGGPACRPAWRLSESQKRGATRPSGRVERLFSDDNRGQNTGTVHPQRQPQCATEACCPEENKGQAAPPPTTASGPYGNGAAMGILNPICLS